MTDEELDTLIADKVMGWIPDDECPRGYRPYWHTKDGKDEGPDYAEWNPSTDIANAWLVVQKIKSQRFGSSNNYPNFGVYDESSPNHPFIWVYFDEWEDDHKHGGTNVTVRAESYSSTLPRAICFAALRVVGAIEKHEGRTLLD